MSLRINTNVASMAAQRNLSVITERLGGHYARLSSGLRIVSAADDPAGLAVSTRMEAQLRSMSAAQRNVQDGVSLLRVLDGALGEIADKLVRARELIIASMNGTASQQDRQLLDEEYQALAAEMGRIVDSTEFNGVSLLSAWSTVQVQVGTEAAEQIPIALRDVSVLETIMSMFALDTTDANRNTALWLTDIVQDYVGGMRGEYGALTNRLQSAARSLQTQQTSLSGAHSRIVDADYAAETAALSRDSILQQAAVSVLAQANVQPVLALELLQPLSAQR